MNKNAGLLAGVAAACLAGGGLCGYLLAVHQLQRRFDRDLEELQAHYSSREERVHRAASLAPVEVPSAVVRVEKRSYKSAGGSEESGNMGEDRELRSDHLPDTFRDEEDINPLEGLEDEDYEPDAARSTGTNGLGDEEDDLLDVEDRSGESDGSESHPGASGPYLITEERFSEERLDYQKLCVTYYGGDNVLCDDKDAPIRDVSGTIGDDVVPLFTNPKPGSPSVVYVRNDWLEVDFEVALNYGAWTEVVLEYGTPHPKPRHILPGEG